MNKKKIQEQINKIVNKAKEENRDLTEDEQIIVDGLMSLLEKSEDKEVEEKENSTEEKSEEEDKDEEKESPEESEEKEKSEDEVKEDTNELGDEEESEDKEEEKEVVEDKEETTNEDSEENKDKEEKENKRNIHNIMNKRNFSLIETVKSIINKRELSPENQAVINAGREEMRKSGLSFDGNLVIPTENRSVSVTDTQGATVGVDVFDILAPLRDNSVLMKAGAKFLTGLQGNVKLPVMGGSGAQWEGEKETATGDAATFTSVELSPKRLAVTMSVSQQFLNQSSESAEAILRQDMANAISEKLQKTLLSNVISNPKAPKGIFAATPDNAGSFKDIVAIESKVDDANVGANRCYILSNKAKAALRLMSKSDKGVAMVYENEAIDGTPAYATSSVADNGLLYGDFSQLYVGQFGPISLTVDPYSKAASGEVVFTINAYFDGALARPTAVVSGDASKATK